MISSVWSFRSAQYREQQATTQAATTATPRYPARGARGFSRLLIRRTFGRYADRVARRLATVVRRVAYPARRPVLLSPRRR